jgi:hypothetical protein
MVDSPLAEQLAGGLENPVGVMDVAGMAGNASATLKNIMGFEPMVAGMVSMFFPPAAIAQPFIVMAMPFLIRALDDIAKSNGGDMIAAFLQLAQHLTAGAPNSPVLTGPVTGLTGLLVPNSSGVYVPTDHPSVTTDGLDPSRQGSG